MLTMITLPQNKIMAAAIFIAAASMYGFKKVSCNRADFKSICASRVTTYWEFYDLNENKIIPFTTSMDFFGFNNRIICLIPEEVISTNVLIDPNDNSVKDLSSSNDIKYSWFLFQRDSSFGLKLDENASVIKSNVDKDSFFNKALYKTLTPVSESDILISHVIDKKNNEIIETFTNKKKIDESFPDTTIIKYSLAGNCFPYSLGNISSRLGKQSIIGIHGIYNASFNKELNKHIPKRILLFQIAPIKDSIPDKVSSLLLNR